MNILVIEDDRLIAKFFTKILRDGSFLLNVDTATDRKQVNQKLFQTKYDLILCDIMLGDTTGPSILREFQNLVDDSPIYLMSCLNDIGAYYSDMINDGFNMIGWQQKPLRSADVQDILGKVKMTHPDCNYPDLKEMLKELASDLKESYRKDLQLLESNLTNAQLKAVQEAKDIIVDVERKQDKMEVCHKEHSGKISKLFEIVDEIRDGYQQAVGAFKLWGTVCGAATVVSSLVAIYVAFR